MTSKAWFNVFGILLLSLLSVGVGKAESQLTGSALVDALTRGGYSIYFRHERTDWSLSDDFMDNEERFSCDPGKMRQLSNEGRQRAQQTGEAMRRAGIPVIEVIASPYCRTVETAKLLDLGAIKKSNAVMNMLVAKYYGGRQAIIETAQTLLSTPTRPGFNRVIVAHGNVAQAATPIYPAEGEAAIFKADGNGGFKAIGRLKASEW